MQQFEGIKGRCAWPHLTRLDGDVIVALIHDQPSHGGCEGDIEAWRSDDRGATWSYLSKVTEHEPGTTRMNHAVGTDADGHLIAIVGGWNGIPPAGQNGPLEKDRHSLRGQVRLSTDGGASWAQIGELPRSLINFNFVPFGKVCIADNGDLVVPAYLAQGNIRGPYETSCLRSSDGGRSWQPPTMLNQYGNETWALHLGDGHWIAASREELDGHLRLMRSTDDARTWTREQSLSLPGQVTGNLIRLADGRVLLSYGNRCYGMEGVDVRYSHDEGRTWSSPVRIGDGNNWDCGYPSTIELSDASLVTAWYVKGEDEHDYRMPVVVWSPDLLRRSYGRMPEDHTTAYR